MLIESEQSLQLHIHCGKQGRSIDTRAQEEIRRVRTRTGAPKRLWCYASNRVAGIHRVTASDIPSMEGRTPEEAVTRSTPDITAYGTIHLFNSSRKKRKKSKSFFLGVHKSCVDELAYCVMASSGKVVVCTSAWALSKDNNLNPVIQGNLEELRKNVVDKVGFISDVTFDLPEVPDDLLDEDDYDTPPMIAVDDNALAKNVDNFTPEAYDEYLTVNVKLSNSGEIMFKRSMWNAHVCYRSNRKLDVDGKRYDRRNSNPMLDTRLYKVEFVDGSVETVTAHLIAENLYSQVDEEGRSFGLMKSIIDHRKGSHFEGKWKVYEGKRKVYDECRCSSTSSDH